MKKSNWARIHHEKMVDGVRVHFGKRRNGVRVHHERDVSSLYTGSGVIFHRGNKKEQWVRPPKVTH